MTDDTTVNVRILVDDVEAAVDFYTSHFGFTVLNAFPPFADVQRGNLRLLLSGPKSSAARPMADGAQPGPGRAPALGPRAPCSRCQAGKPARFRPPSSDREDQAGRGAVGVELARGERQH